MSTPSEMLGGVDERLACSPSNRDHREGPESQSLSRLATSRRPGTKVVHFRAQEKAMWLRNEDMEGDWSKWVDQ